MWEMQSVIEQGMVRQNETESDKVAQKVQQKNTACDRVRQSAIERTSFISKLSQIRHAILSYMRPFQSLIFHIVFIHYVV